MDEGDYDFNKRSDKTYMSPSLPDLDSSGRKIRIATKTFAAATEPEFATVKGELVVRHKEGQKRVVTASFFEDNRDVAVLFLIKLRSFWQRRLKVNARRRHLRAKKESDKIRPWLDSDSKRLINTMSPMSNWGRGRATMFRYCFDTPVPA